MTGIIIAAGACFALGAAAGWLLYDWWARLLVDEQVDDVLDEVAVELGQDVDDWGHDGVWLRRVK